MVYHHYQHLQTGMVPVQGVLLHHPLGFKDGTLSKVLVNHHLCNMFVALFLATSLRISKFNDLLQWVIGIFTSMSFPCTSLFQSTLHEYLYIIYIYYIFIYHKVVVFQILLVCYITVGDHPI